MENNQRPTIAIMLGDTQSSYSEDLLRGFYTCAREEDINIIFLMGPQMPQYCKDILSCSFDGDYNYQFDTIYDYVHFTKPDALIITYGSLSIFKSNQVKADFLSHYKDIPFLMLEDTPDDPGIPYLIADNYNGMRQCIEHLVNVHGYRKIAFVAGPANNKDSNERLKAYRDVMAEHQLPVTNDMVVYGNYSELVTEQVEYILDHNPELEAIAFANDNMAKAGYRVCAARDLLVGHDIAITGFDDIDHAKTMEPPLTSVSHSSFQFSYQALQNALMLCQGKKPQSCRMSAIFHQRSSCGCQLHTGFTTLRHISMEQLHDFIHQQVDAMAEELFSSISYEKDRNYYTEVLHAYFENIYEEIFIRKGTDFSNEPLIRYLRKLTAYPHISGEMLLEQLTSLLRTLINFSEEELLQTQLSGILSFTQQYVHSADVFRLEKEIMDSNRKAWFVPSFTRDLINSGANFKETITHIMERLHLMNVKSSFFFFFDKPVIHQENELAEYPDEIYLAAYYHDEKSVYHEPGKRPKVTTANGFSSFLPKEHSHCYTSFILFSGDEQFGLLLCEVEQKDISFMQICSLQIGALLHFIQLNASERQIQKELQDSMKVIQEQNSILSYISEYDDLSQLLNRRGFMERASHAIESNSGKKAYLLFGDLDHLKEINDCFSHLAGDFALRTVSERLRKCLPKDAITARLGGDEFVSFILTDIPDFKEQLLKNLKAESDAFNAVCDKPFYVEISVGIYDFYCNPQMDLTDILKHSDAILYEEKAKRRSSIKKV